MAAPKKGQLAQFQVPMVDSTDFASIESGITASDFNSGATVKFFGANHGGSAATTSGTVSKIASLVRSGMFRITLKGSENNYDEMSLRINKTGCAEQILQWRNVDNDDSDIMSTLTLIQSMASDAASAATQANSRVLLTQSRVSDVYSLLSDLESNILSRVPKEVAARSQLSDLSSDLRSYVIGLSGMISDVQSALSDAHSDLASKVGGITVTISASDVSDIASAVVAGLPIASVVSDIYSLLSDLNSQFLSRIPKEPAARSQLSDIGSDLLSYLVGVSGAVSDTHSAATAGASRALLNQSHASNIYSLLSDLESNFGSRVPKEVAARSQLSDIGSDLRSYVVGVSGAISDVQSALAAGIEVGASSMSDLRSAITANGVFAAGADPTGVVGPTDSTRAKIDWLTAMSRNKLTQTATSAVVHDDSGNAIASAAVSDDGTTFTRNEWH